MKKTVVFEAAATEKCVKRVQTLLPLNRFGKRSVHVGRAERRQLHSVGGLQKVLIPAGTTGDKKQHNTITCFS